jgi:hypothetical protein
MTTGMELIDLLAAALTLTFIGKLLFISVVGDNSNTSGNREKISLLNQQIGPKWRAI